MRARSIAALLAPMLLSGCMMAGMAGMGGMGPMSGGGTHDGSPAVAPGAPTIVKEVVAGGLRVTADFPAYAPGDSLSYTVTLRGLDGRAITTDASVFLEVSPATMDGAALPAPMHAEPPAKIAHAMPGGLERMRVTPVERGGGRFVFRPSIPRAGAYRLTVLVERAGDTVLDPPIAVEQVVQMLPAAMGTPMAAEHTMRGWGLTPLMLLGAGFMAVMMLVAVR